MWKYSSVDHKMEMESKKLWVLEDEDRTVGMETKLKVNIKENLLC